MRDVAKIHIAALSTTVPNGSRPRRVPIASPYPSDFVDAIQFIHDERPELRERLADPTKVPRWDSYKLDMDLTPLEKSFEVPISSLKTWRETILDAVDRFIALEKVWTSKGFEFEVPSQPPM